jgi:hypothetical protein
MIANVPELRCTSRGPLTSNLRPGIHVSAALPRKVVTSTRLRNPGGGALSSRRPSRGSRRHGAQDRARRGGCGESLQLLRPGSHYRKYLRHFSGSALGHFSHNNRSPAPKSRLDPSASAEIGSPGSFSKPGCEMRHIQSSGGSRSCVLTAISPRTDSGGPSTGLWRERAQ